MSLIFDEQCSDLYPSEEIIVESEDGLFDLAYTSFTQNVPETVLEVNDFISSTLYAESGNTDVSESPLVSMPASSQLSSQPGLPVIANRPSMQWITSSINDIRTQSPLKTSSPHSTSSTYSPSHKLPHQPSSMDSQSSVTISHHELPTAKQPAKTLEHNSPLKKLPTKPKGTPGRKRKFQDHELSPAEAARRHVRRERNKVAAAKCRNRRRELTDRLQGETDHLEDHQQMLQQEIIALEQEKQKLEYLLAHHAPNCKAGIADEYSVTLPHINGTITTIEPSSPPSSIPSYITNNLVPNLSENYSTFYPHRNAVQSVSEAQSVSSAQINSPYNLNRSFDPNYRYDVGSTSAFRPVNVNSFRRENINALNSNIPASLRDTSTLRTSYFPGPHEGFSNIISQNTSVPFSTAAPTFSAIPLDQRNLASKNFCSFDHRRQSVVDCPCAGSVRSPTHLLAL